MQLNQSIESVMRQINGFDRRHCIDELKAFPYIKLDFTDEFLQEQSLDRLRHILMAAILVARRHL